METKPDPLLLSSSTTSDGVGSAHTAHRVYPVEAWLVHKLLESLGNPPLSVVLWDGREIPASRPASPTRMRIGNRVALARLLMNPSVEFGDAYTEGQIQVEGSLVDLLETVGRSKSVAASLPALRAGLPGWLRWKNSLRRARRSIHHHYDIGNDFYRLWLDERMVYTCAYFEQPTVTLEEAQVAKLDYICRKLRLRPGESVVEAGCGWGALALHMARNYGVAVKAYNISHEQILHAREQAEKEGVGDRVQFIQDDYRNITGSFDVFVSVGMLEHVGRGNYHTLGRVMNRCLKDPGRGLLHSIGRNHPKPLNAWIRKRIFPGAYPPSLGEMMEIFEPHGFSVLDIENLRLHYAHTLEHWLERFEESADRVAAMFDERFVRTWRLYLAGSVAAFRTGWLQLFQAVFARARDNRIPWTRAPLYTGERAAAE